MSAAGAISAALGADTDHVVCFGRRREYRWQELLAAAADVRAHVADTDARRWALNLDDTFQFTAALLGCWAARKVPVLAPRLMLQNDTGTLAFDGVIESGRSAVKAKTRLDWRRLRSTRERIREIAATEQIVLYTSGSTGVPKEVSRYVYNIEAELAVLESLWGHLVGGRVYSTVSHRHVYGVLFRVLWPLLNRRPFATFDYEYPEQVIGPSTAGHALVSSPALLKRIGHLAHNAGAWSVVFSSGGLLPAQAATDGARVLSVFPVEVLGSTETSGVGWRRQEPAQGAASFVALPNVEVRAGADELLEVRSPFSGKTDWLGMGDRVRFVGDGRFELLGRGDHVAKIEDKRVSLAEIEGCLLGTIWVKEAAAIALHDAARQYVGVALELSEAGAAELARQGRRGMNEMLKAALRSRIDPVGLPRRFRYVAAIPVDAQGKRTQSRLRELFER